MIPYEAAAVLAVVWIGYATGHRVGDYWMQTSWQARTKGLPGWIGRRACLAHVGTYTLGTMLAVGGVIVALGLPVSVPAMLTGQGVSAVTHYFADRRQPLYRLARLLGKDEFWSLGFPRLDRDDNPTLGTGAWALDQAWHHAWLFVAAIVTVAVPW